jgi:hypothetical protein
VGALHGHSRARRAIRRRIKDRCGPRVSRERYGIVTEENVIDGHTELRRKSVKSSNRRLDLSRFDLRNRTRRQIKPTGKLPQPNTVTQSDSAESRTELERCARHVLIRS